VHTTTNGTINGQNQNEQKRRNDVVSYIRKQNDGDIIIVERWGNSLFKRAESPNRVLGTKLLMVKIVLGDFDGR